MTTNTRTLGLVLALASAIACEIPQKNKAGTGSTAQGGTLANTKVPPGFTWQNSRSVAVNLTGKAALIPQGEPAMLELARPDGVVLYQGRLTAKQPSVDLNVAVPNKDQKLIATLVLKDGRKLRQELPVAQNAAKHTFE